MVFFILVWLFMELLFGFCLINMIISVCIYYVWCVLICLLICLIVVILCKDWKKNVSDRIVLISC